MRNVGAGSLPLWWTVSKYHSCSSRGRVDFVSLIDPARDGLRRTDTPCGWTASYGAGSLESMIDNPD